MSTGMESRGSSSVRDRLAAAGLRLPAPIAVKGGYARVRVTERQAWIAGHTGRGPGGPLHVGVVGEDVTMDQAREEATAAALNVLAALAGAGQLDRVTAVVQLRGLIRAVPSFTEHPVVVDAASDVLLAAFGVDVGTHARTAFGVASLPGGAPVELEAVFEVR